MVQILPIRTRGWERRLRATERCRCNFGTAQCGQLATFELVRRGSGIRSLQTNYFLRISALTLWILRAQGLSFRRSDGSEATAATAALRLPYWP